MTPEISPAVVLKMVAFIHECDRLTDDGHTHHPFVGKSSTDDELRLRRELRAIVALLPEPVDPDLVEARKIVAVSVFGDAAEHDPEFSLEKALLTEEASLIENVLLGIKRGRELERGQ